MFYTLIYYNSLLQILQKRLASFWKRWHFESILYMCVQFKTFISTCACSYVLYPSNVQLETFCLEIRGSAKSTLIALFRIATYVLRCIYALRHTAYFVYNILDETSIQIYWTRVTVHF